MSNGDTADEGSESIVLIVDDDEAVADTYSMWLEDDYNVRTAYSGREALEQISDEVGVVLLDRRMPNLPGDEVLERIRDKDIDCMVSMLTAVKPNQNITELEFDEYLSKPVSKDELVSTVEELLFRDEMDEETQEYLAMKATDESIQKGTTEEVRSDEIEELRRGLKTAESNTSVRKRVKELERLSHLSKITRSANRAVIRSESTEELGQAICRELVVDLPYKNVIFGKYAEEEFIPDSGVDRSIDTGSVPLSSGDPLKEALEEKRVVATSSTGNEDGSIGRLSRDASVSRVFKTAVVVPAEYQNRVRGGIVLFSDEEIELTDRERSTLLEVGAAVGNAIDSLQTRELVNTDSVVEIEMEIRDKNDVLVDLSARHGCRVQVNGVHLNSGGSIACYLTISYHSSEELMGFLAEREGVEKYQVMDDSGEDILFQCHVSDSSILLDVVEATAGPVDFFIDDGVGNLKVQMPPSVNIHSVFEAIKKDFEDTKLVSKKNTNTPYQSIGRFRGAVDDRLTQRQDEVLTTAFKAGYFNWPRKSTAEEVAEMLDLAPSTLHEHLREGQRILVETYLEETDTTESL